MLYVAKQYSSGKYVFAVVVLLLAYIYTVNPNRQKTSIDYCSQQAMLSALHGTYNPLSPKKCRLIFKDKGPVTIK